MDYRLNQLPNYLLTVSGNPKTDKNKKLGYGTAILHLAPNKLSGANVCPAATPGCIAACLNTAGKAGMIKAGETTNNVQIARIQRTRLLRRDRKFFMQLLSYEIERFVSKCKKQNLIPTIRLNGTSDLIWENIKVDNYKNIFAKFPDIQFYDYTKIHPSKRDTTIPNYHLTFSLAETEQSKLDAIDAIRKGLNVAIVFKSELPKSYSFGGSFRKVINGDITDTRFLDGTGSIIGLKAKGKARHDTTGFVKC